MPKKIRTLKIRNIPVPLCEPCSENGYVHDAYFIAAQSNDQGISDLNWQLICAICKTSWNDGGDWIAPIWRLGSRIKEKGE